MKKSQIHHGYHALRKMLQRNDTFKPVIWILVKWYIRTDILTMITPAIFVKIPAEMCQFTRIPMTCLNVSLMLQNFSQCMVNKIIQRKWIKFHGNLIKTWLYMQQSDWFVTKTSYALWLMCPHESKICKYSQIPCSSTWNRIAFVCVQHGIIIIRFYKGDNQVGSGKSYNK